MSVKKKILFVLGTRPEAIKLAPLIHKFQEDKKNFEVGICSTGQHKEMLYSILEFFNITPDFELNVMKKSNNLFNLTANILEKIFKVLEKFKPNLIIVQGDTTTAFTGALAGFYKRIKIAHIEAGLRSFNKYSPFPEELNRKLVAQLADYHFAPTIKAKENLLREGIDEKRIWIVGNTVIDALLMGLSIVKSNKEEQFYEEFKFIDFSKKLILVTTHRRENWGKPLENICLALENLVKSFPDIEIIFPVHLNPNVRNIVFNKLKKIERIHLLEPLTYPQLIWLMEKSYLVLTDSGGLQEEAPSLAKPVLILRDTTERVEGIDTGVAKLVGTKAETIIKEVGNLLKNRKLYTQISLKKNPYGDGKASERIFEILKRLDF